MKKLALLFVLFSVCSYSQFYTFDKKQIKLDDTWVIEETNGCVVINPYQIAIGENKVITPFNIYKVKNYGKNYRIYYCKNKNKKKVTIVRINKEQDDCKFTLIYASSIIYCKYFLSKI